MKKHLFKKIGFLSLLLLFLGLSSLRHPFGSPLESYTGGLHFISFKQLVSYINEFRNSASTYDLNKLSQGGFVDAEVLTTLIENGAQGVVFHYCVDSAGTGVPFLAFQACADSSNISILNNDVLNVSYDEHVSNNSSSAEITAELLSDTIANTGSNSTISGSNARDYKNTFTGLFGSGNVTLSHGYINAEELLQLIQENGSDNLHYYWGYDDTESVNKLRLCFTGHSSRDEINYILDSNTQSYHSFIDRSWP